MYLLIFFCFILYDHGLSRIAAMQGEMFLGLPEPFWETEFCKSIGPHSYISVMFQQAASNASK